MRHAANEPGRISESLRARTVAARAIRALAVGLVALAVCGLPEGFAADLAHAPHNAVEELGLAPGAEGTVVTVLQGNETQEIPLTYLGTYKDFAGPGYDLHLVQLQGPEAERVGVAAGMSGSPVYFHGRVIGALSYRLGLMPKGAVAGVTPIEDMLESVRQGAPAEEDAATGIARIATPILAGGLTPGARQWLAPLLEARGFVLVAGGGQADAATDETTRLGPGSPVGVQLVRGDMRIAATGTVTWVDGDRVYAFGHPFLGSGRVEMPMVSAEVIHTLADLAGSVKLANVGSELGAIVEDRHAAVIGLMGREAAMIPVSLSIRGGDYGEEQFEFELVKNSDLAPLLSAVSVLNALQTGAGYSQKSTLTARGTVRLRGLPDVPLEMAFAGAAGADPTVAMASELYGTLGALWANPFLDVDVEGLELVVDARREIVSYRLESIQYDRKAYRPGETLRVKCVLRRYKGDTTTREIELQLPERLPERDLVLAVGNPRDIDSVLGGQLARRIESAADSESFVGVFADLRGPNHLAAMVYTRGGAVVARGSSYVRLPPTAEHLLATQAVPSRRARASISPVTRADELLDGPLVGTKQARLKVEPRQGPEENR